jgi:hypothetical protein
MNILHPRKFGCLNTILAAKIRLETNGVTPKLVRMSPLAHECLLLELSEKDGKKHTRVYEICGLKIEIEEECPAGGAYIEGE